MIQGFWAALCSILPGIFFSMLLNFSTTNRSNFSFLKKNYLLLFINFFCIPYQSYNYNGAFTLDVKSMLK
jgi:hypothetical protein